MRLDQPRQNALRTSCMFIMLMAAFSNTSKSQPWYFNEVYNPNNTWAIGTSIIGTESGSIGCAVTGDGTSNNFYETSTILLNPQGNLIALRNFGKYGCDFYAGDEGALAQNGEYYGLFGSVIDYLNGSSYGLFYKLNASGDTIFTRIFTSDSDTILYGRICIATIDGGFALLGNVFGNEYNKEILLIKTDPNGNEMWRNRFGSEFGDMAKSLIQTTDQGYAIGSWRYSAGYDPSTYDPVVIKADSFGNYEWELNLGGPYADDEPKLCNSQDSCIIALTTYGDTMLGFTAAKARTNLVKINLLGEVVWNKKFTTNDNDNHSSSIIALENGDFITCGYSWASAFLETSWLFRFSPDGDSLWFRDYYYYYGENYIYSVNKLYDISKSEDNGFISTGQAYSDLTYNIQKMWVLKVDSVGCEIENCWVGVEEEKGTRGQGDKGKLEIWPNPASKIVNCQLSNVDFRNKSSTFDLQSSISVYDIFGRQAPAPSLTPSPKLGEGRGGGEDGGDGVWTVDVSSVPPGIYFIVIRDERNVIGTGKFVVAR